MRSRTFLKQRFDIFFEDFFVPWVVALVAGADLAFAVDQYGKRAVTFGVEDADDASFCVEQDREVIAIPVDHRLDL